MSTVAEPQSWQRVVDGLLMPQAVGKDPALEFCNTLAGWGGPASTHTEYLVSYPHLVALTRASGLLVDDRATRANRLAIRHPEAAEEVVARARSVRADLYAVLIGGSSAAAFRRVADAVQGARGELRLVPAPREEEASAARARWELGSRPRLTDPLDLLLIHVGDLLTEPPGDAVRRCPGHECGWLFIDRSGRRRWCQMQVCGNRAKQAAFQQRQARTVAAR